LTDLLIKYSLRSALFISTILLFACAADYQRGPSGGDDDKTAPSVSAIFPQPGAVNQPRDLTISVEFDEYIRYSTTAGAISISPLSAQEKATIDWGEKDLEITFKDLDSNLTVLIMLKTSLTDIQGNRLKDNVVIPFSTGSKLDSAAFGGMVFEAIVNNDLFALPAAEMVVQLFKAAAVADSGYQKNRPEYEFGLSGNGRFDVNFLTSGKYAPLVYRDKNRNGKADFDQEEFFTSGLEPLTLESGKKLSTAFIPGAVDTIPPYVKEVKVISADLLSVHFSKLISPAEFQVDSLIFKQRNYFKSLYRNSQMTDKFILQTDSLSKSAEAELFVKPFKDLYGNQSVIQGQSKRFLTPDSLPVVKAGIAGNLVTTLALDDTLLIPLTQPELKSFTIQLAQSDIKAAYQDFSQHLTFEPFLQKLPLEKCGLTTGDYRVLIKTGQDTIFLNKLNIAAKTGTGSLSGRIIKADSAKCNMIIKPLKPGQKSRLLSLKNGNYKINLLPGSYKVAAYLDRNSDNQYNPGGMKKIPFAEPALVLPDTIKIRKNWEQSGFDLDFGKLIKP